MKNYINSGRSLLKQRQIEVLRNTRKAAKKYMAQEI